MDSSYKTMQDEGIEKKIKFLEWSQKNLLISANVLTSTQASNVHILNLTCMDSSYEILQDRGIAKKMKSFRMILKEFVDL